MFSGAVFSCGKEVGGDATLVVIFAKRKRAVPLFLAMRGRGEKGSMMCVECS